MDEGQVVLEARQVAQPGTFRDVSFALHKGEILGFYGLVGSGRTELAQILIGEARRSAGEVLINGQPAQIRSMADSLYHYRMGYVSENRKEKGLILGASIKTNTAITVWNRSSIAWAPSSWVRRLRSPRSTCRAWRSRPPGPTSRSTG